MPRGWRPDGAGARLAIKTNDRQAPLGKHARRSHYREGGSRRSAGCSRRDSFRRRPAQHVRLCDEIEGAILASGDLLLHDGSLGRIDLQKPIHASYQIRITSQQTVTIRLRQSGEGSPIPVDGDALQIEVDERPPARIALHWKSINRLSPRDLEALLRIDNTGGTSAVGLRMVVDVPGDVSVSTGDFGTERLDSGTSRTVAVRISSGGIPSGSVRFTLSHQSVGGESSETALALDLNRVIESDIDRLPIVGRSKAREEISRALFEDHSVLIDLHGSPGVGKRKLVRSALERATNAEGKQVEFYEIDCRMADSFAEAVFMLLNRLVVSLRSEPRIGCGILEISLGCGYARKRVPRIRSATEVLEPRPNPKHGHLVCAIPVAL